jgi:RNA polymerase sigma-70 factor (ECF subfamily)
VILSHILLLALQSTLQSATGRSSIEDENALVERARNFEDDAWQTIFETHYPRLFAYLYYRTGDPDVAEDLCGEVFERAVKHIKRFKPRDGGLGGWLTRIAQNLAHDYHRRNRSRPPDPLELNESWIAQGEDPSHHLLSRESARYLQKALEKLTPEQRDVILLRFIAQLRTAEVAHIMGKPQSAIKALQRRALAALRRELENLGYHGPI